jgi:hypothetical protein
MKIVGIVLLLLSAFGVANAASAPAPEINAQAGLSALTLLSGSILVIRGRRR